MCSHIYKKRQKRKDRKTSISNWTERLFIFRAPWFWHSIDILSYPNNLSEAYIMKCSEMSCPNFCCKTNPNWDIWPEIFYPTSCLWPDQFRSQFSFNIKVQISGSQFEPFFLDTIKTKSKVQLVLLKRKLDPSSNQTDEVSKFLPLLDLLYFFIFCWFLKIRCCCWLKSII